MNVIKIDPNTKTAEEITLKNEREALQMLGGLMIEITELIPGLAIQSDMMKDDGPGFKLPMYDDGKKTFFGVCLLSRISAGSTLGGVPCVAWDFANQITWTE